MLLTFIDFVNNVGNFNFQFWHTIIKHWFYWGIIVIADKTMEIEGYPWSQISVSFSIYLSVLFCLLPSVSFLPTSMNRWKKKELCRLKNPPWTIMPITEKHVVHIFNAKLHKLHLLKSKKQTRTHTTHSHALNLFFSVYILKPA